MQVVELRRHRNRQVVAVVRELLALAEEGDVHGLTFAVTLGPRDHRVGVVGIHRKNPAEALLAVLRMKKNLLSED